MRNEPGIIHFPLFVNPSFSMPEPKLGLASTLLQGVPKKVISYKMGAHLINEHFSGTPSIPKIGDENNQEEPREINSLKILRVKSQDPCL